MWSSRACDRPVLWALSPLLCKADVGFNDGVMKEQRRSKWSVQGKFWTVHLKVSSPLQVSIICKYLATSVSSHIQRHQKRQSVPWFPAFTGTENCPLYLLCMASRRLLIEGGTSGGIVERKGAKEGGAQGGCWERTWFCTLGILQVLQFPHLHNRAPVTSVCVCGGCGVNLSLALLALPCVWVFSSRDKWGLPFATCSLLIAMVSLVAKYRML